MSDTLYTIGYAGHDLESFVDCLNAHQITAVVDVRSSPFSQYYASFNRPILHKSLNFKGIAYVYLGQELGAFRQDPDSYDGDQVNYQKAAQEDIFKAGIERLFKGMSRYRIAMMCAEKDATTCHRMLLISRALDTQGVEIQHIDGACHLESQKMAEMRLMQTLGIVPDLFRTHAQCLALAYTERARKKP